jgi:hypothetical protein
VSEPVVDRARDTMARRRRRWTFPRLGWFLFALLCIAGAGVFRTISVYGRFSQPQFSQRQFSQRQFSQQQAPSPGMVTDGVPVRRALEVRPGRTVYPYSIIRGGVASVAEFTAALRRDAVAAGHYVGFHQETVRTMQAPKSMLLYASYRIGDAVYWTTHRVHIAAGELLITDGAGLARGRCGNRLSNSPQAPVHPNEPTEKEMDTVSSFDFVAPTATANSSLDRWLGPTPPGAPVSALVLEIFPAAPLAAAAPGAVSGFPGGISGGTLGSGGFLGVSSPPGISLPPGGTTANPGPIPTSPPVSSLPLPPPPGTVAEPSAPPILDSAPNWINWQPIMPLSELNPTGLPPVKIGQSYPPVFPGSPGGGGGFPIEPGSGDSGTYPGQTPTSNPISGEGPGGSEPGVPGTSIGDPNSSGPSQIIPEPAAAALAGVGLVCLWLAGRRFKARSH